MTIPGEIAGRLDALPPQRWLVVNADDLGMSVEVNEAVRQAYCEGIVTTASLLGNFAGFEDAVRLLREYPGLDAGVHLNISGGRPLSPASEVPSLVALDKFHSWPRNVIRFLTGQMNAEEVAREWSRQIERVLDAGVEVSHLDSHHHLHILPGLFEVTLHLAREFGIPWVRVPYDPPSLLVLSGPGWPMRFTKLLGANLLAQPRRAHLAREGLLTAHHFRGNNVTSVLTETSLLALLEQLPLGVTELACHPGVGPGENKSMRMRRKYWQREQQALVSPLVQEAVEHRMSLTNFRELTLRVRV